jgi:AraC-like DNA-binding protein
MLDTPFMFLSRNPDLERFVEWLISAGVDVSGVLKTALMEQRAAGRFLKLASHNTYQRRTVLNIFIHRVIEAIRAHPSQENYKLLQLAIILALPAAEVLRAVARFCRRSFVDHYSVASNRDATNFVTERASHLARKLVTNLKLGTPRSVLSYLRRVAVSHYLGRVASRLRRQKSALSHVEESTKIRRRTALAFKLAYLPAALTRKDLAELQREYGWAGVERCKHKIKDIAERLGFKNAATLYRKFYKIREWADNTQGASSRGGRLTFHKTVNRLVGDPDLIPF